MPGPAHSIVFDAPGERMKTDGVAPPDCFGDLHLDQVVAVNHRVLGVWLRDVMATVGLAGVVGITLGAGGSTVIVGLPAWGYPLVAAIAALTVVVGTGRALIVRGHGGRIDRGEDA